MENYIENEPFSLNNEKIVEKDMPITISDEELISMEPELLLSLQKFLKEYRNKKPTEILTNVNEVISKKENSLDDGLIIIKSWYSEINEAQFDEVETTEGKFLGTRISQDGKSYIARNWKITEEVKTIIIKAAKSGFSKLWRQNHPQDRYFYNGPDYLKGSHHIGFSKSHSSPWLFVLGGESLSRIGGIQRVKEITFNKFFGEIMKSDPNLTNQSTTDYSESIVETKHFKIQHGGGKNYTTHPNDFDYLIDLMDKKSV